MYAIGTLPARFPDSESTLKRLIVRLSVLGPVANLHVRFRHACGSLIKVFIGTLKRTQCRELRPVR